MFQFALLLLLAQMPSKAQVEKFRKEAAVLQEGINEAVESAVPGFALLQRANGVYLDGVGAVFTLQTSLEPTRNPFSSPKSPAEVRTIVTERRKAVKQKLLELVKQKAATLDSIAPTESITIVLNLMNTNPADLPDLPSQLIIIVRKQDALDFRDNKLDAAAFASKISAQEF
jgi:hypothetical protein